MKVILAVLLCLGLALASPAPPKKQFPERIVGGSQASRGEFPIIVQIKVGGGHYCGGSIINSQYIVTAAHCATNSASSYTVVAGEHNLGSNEGSEQSRSVSQIIRHPNYNSNTQANDIAIMKLSSPLTLGTYAKAATLASSDPTGNVIVAGWGALTEGGGSPSVLYKVTVPMVTTSSCKNSYGSSEILTGMICAGTGGKDSCQGDSGGPLMTTSGTLVGIVSWGYGCARPGYPGVYTSVANYRSWINSNS